MTTVEDLINNLKSLPEDTPVQIPWNGGDGFSFHDVSVGIQFKKVDGSSKMVVVLGPSPFGGS